MQLTIPQDYKPLLNMIETERAIKLVKDFFQDNLSAELRLRRVTAPLFVLKGTGINDDLNGTERAVSFPIKDLGEQSAEVVHSLAKWKRMALADQNIPVGYGLYTDMNAIRADEELSNIHSLYVDQWDWEKSIRRKERSLKYLKKTVESIFSILKRVEYLVYESFPQIKPILPEIITFIHSEDLHSEYPYLSPKDREDKATEKYGAVFIIGIGGELADGTIHDGRAPDYDDWTTPTENNYKGLNGDILVWNSILKRSFELSSMGVRVDKEALEKQLNISNEEFKKDLFWHKRLLQDELPLSIGGGIGQSRLCMYFLQKAHIGEIQSSIWPDEMRKLCNESNIALM